jgi:hypothetical protein
MRGPGPDLHNSCRSAASSAEASPVFPRTGQKDDIAGLPEHDWGSGADTRIRTEDLLFTKQLLYR